MTEEQENRSLRVRRPIVIALGKLMVHVAWADGVIEREEVEVIKDLVFTLPDLTQEEWASVEIYFEYPVSDRERDRLLEDFVVLLQHDTEKSFAVEAIDKVIRAEGEPSTEQQAVFEEFKQAIQSPGTGVLTQLVEILTRLFDMAKDRRRKATQETYNRERDLDDFINNPVFFRLSRQIRERKLQMHFNKAELRKLSLAGSMMARIAQADHELHDDEIAIIFEALVETWKLSEESALLVTEIATHREYGSLDMLRICRQFYEVTDESERRSFCQTLAKIVRADDKILKSELDEIEAIAGHFKIHRSDLHELLDMEMWEENPEQA